MILGFGRVNKDKLKDLAGPEGSHAVFADSTQFLQLVKMLVKRENPVKLKTSFGALMTSATRLFLEGKIENIDQRSSPPMILNITDPDPTSDWLKGGAYLSVPALKPGEVYIASQEVEVNNPLLGNTLATLPCELMQTATDAQGNVLELQHDGLHVSMGKSNLIGL